MAELGSIMVFILSTTCTQKEIGRFTGYIAMVQPRLTCTIPALAILLNFWEKIALWHLMVAIQLSYVAVLMMFKKSESKLQFN